MDDERAARLFAKVIGILLDELDQDGIAIIDPVTDENLAIFASDGQIRIDETGEIETDGSFITLIKEEEVH